MDLNTYYEHARLLQHQAEEAERMEAEKREEAILSQWRIVAAKLRELLPVEGMKFVATFDGQFNEAPVKYRMGFDVDCVIRPDVLPIPLGECKLKRSDLNDRKGVIRATVYWDDDASPAGWDVHSYVVSVKGQDVRFTAPYLAFIAAYDELQAETQENT